MENKFLKITAETQVICRAKRPRQPEKCLQQFGKTKPNAPRC
jgi:hypothetical protein